MSTSKSQKAELVAIYRLEFYKKQSNWKLSSSRKSRTPKKTVGKEILNTTYNVDEKTRKEDLSDALNVAFVDSDSDKNPKLRKCPNSPELSQEWQEPVNIRPPSETHNNTIEKFNPGIHCTKQRLENLQRAADLANLENNFCNKSTNCPQNLPTWNECPQYINVPTNIAVASQNVNTLPNISPFHSIAPQNINPPTTLVNCPQNCGEGLEWPDCGEFEDNWLMETPICIGAGHMTQDICKAENLDVVDGNTPDIYSGEWPQIVPADELSWSLNTEGDTSLDSAGEFMRGADGVPHSSEIDLSLPNCVKACDVSFTSLSRLSSQQLVLAARLHSRVLRRLLRESQTRQKLRMMQSLNTSDFSYEEFPTRDVGPAGQLAEDLFLKDVIVAGSHKNVGVVGRGRGRLPKSGLKPFSR